MQEIGLEAEILGRENELQDVLVKKVKDVIPSIKNVDKAKKLDRELLNMNNKQLIDALIENIIEVKCIKPSFIMNQPIIMSPLAKTHAQGRTCGSPFLAERFELFINRMEIINSYSEQNDESLQRQGFSL